MIRPTCWAFKALLAGATCAAVSLATPSWAEGDAAKGKKVFNKCKTCHSLEAGKKKIGPHLAGLFGRAAGSVEGYKYSNALLDSGVVWDDESLDAYITKPKEFIPKTKMNFAGLKKEADRANLIAYLKEATQ